MIRPFGLDAYLLYLPGLFFILPLLLLLVCSRRTKISFFRLSMALLLVFHWLLPLRLHHTDSLRAQYRLVSLNVQSHSSDVQAATRRLRALKPDFICFQEIWHRPELEDLEQLLSDYLVIGAAPDESERQNFNEGTFLAIRNDWNVEETSLKEESAVAKVSRGDETVIVVSVHAPRAKSFSPSGLRQTIEEQTGKSEELRDELSAFQDPILIAGDFNAPESGPAFKILGKRFHSAFRQAGTGFGLTFPSAFPLARIDHALGTKEVLFTRYRTQHFGSDHLGLVVDFQVSK